MRILLIVVTGLLASATSRADLTSYARKVELRSSGQVTTCVHHHDWSARSAAGVRDEDPFRVDNRFAWLECTDAGGKLLFRSGVPALTALWVTPDGRHIVGLSNVKLDNPIQLVVFDRAGALVFSKHIVSKETCIDAPDYEAFLEAWPKTRALLAGHETRVDARVYLDFPTTRGSFLIGQPAWIALGKVRHECSARISRNISESVGNWVAWYQQEAPRTDGRKTLLTTGGAGIPRVPDLRLLSRDGRATTLIVPDPAGVAMVFDLTASP